MIRLMLFPVIFIGGGITTLVAADSVPAPYSWIADFGALGIVGFGVFWVLTRTIPEMNKMHQETIKEVVAGGKEERRELGERLDRWEKNAREDSSRAHDDSTRLNDTLGKMMSNCQKTFDKLQADDHDRGGAK